MARPLRGDRRDIRHRPAAAGEDSGQPITFADLKRVRRRNYRPPPTPQERHVAQEQPRPWWATSSREQFTNEAKKRQR